MVDEILDPETSNEDLVDDMMTVYRENNDPASEKTKCAGNISYGCVRESLNYLSDALEGFDDWCLIGGIPTQLEFVRREGEGDPRVTQYFGRRMTNDLDILTTDAGELNRRISESDYDEDTMLKIDTIKASSGPIDSEIARDIVEYDEDDPESVQRSEWRSYSAYNSDPTPLDARLRVPMDEELMYTKIHDSESRQSEGTSADAEVMANSDIFNVGMERGSRLDDMTRGNPEARDYYEKLISA